MHTKFKLENSRGRDHLQDPGADEIGLAQHTNFVYEAMKRKDIAKLRKKHSAPWNLLH
jgi:hypothetical protein